MIEDAGVFTASASLSLQDLGVTKVSGSTIIHLLKSGMFSASLCCEM